MVCAFIVCLPSSKRVETLIKADVHVPRWSALVACPEERAADRRQDADRRARDGLRASLPWYSQCRRCRDVSERIRPDRLFRGHTVKLHEVLPATGVRCRLLNCE